MIFCDLRLKSLVLNYSNMRQLIFRFGQLQPIHQLSMVGAMVAILLHLLAWLIFSNFDFTEPQQRPVSKSVPLILPTPVPVSLPTPEASGSASPPVGHISTPAAPPAVKKATVQSTSKHVVAVPSVAKALPQNTNRAISSANSNKAQSVKPMEPLQASAKPNVPLPSPTSQQTELITFTAPLEISGVTVPEQVASASKPSQPPKPRVVAGWQQRQILYAIAARNKAARKQPIDINEVTPAVNNSQSQ